MKNKWIKMLFSGTIALCLLGGTSWAATTKAPTGTTKTPTTGTQSATPGTTKTTEKTEKSDPAIKTQVQSTQIPAQQRSTLPAPAQIKRVSRPAAIDAPNAIMVEAGTGNVMWSKNAYQKAYPASTTKIMTAILFHEQYKDQMDKSFTVGDELDKMPQQSSIMGLKKEQTITAEQLMVGLMLLSGNDAALVMAQNCGGYDAFVEKMNQRAREYGMDGTQFKNPHGFHHAEHYTTAADFAKLARQYYKNDYLMQICGTKTYRLPNLASGELETIYNTNRLLGARDKDKSYAYEYANGMKTGYTDAAKNCFVASAAMGDNSIILVTLGSSSTEARFGDAKALLSYGLTNFEPVQIYEYIKDVSVQVGFGDLKLKEYEYGVFDTMIQINAQEMVNIDRDAKALLEKNEGEVKARFSADKDLQFPIKEGDLLGNIEFVVNEETVIYSTRAVSAKYYVARQTPTLFSTLRLNQQNAYDEKPYFEQMLRLGHALAQKDPGKLMPRQPEKKSEQSPATPTEPSSKSTPPPATPKSTSTTPKSTDKSTQKTTTGSKKSTTAA